MSVYHWNGTDEVPYDVEDVVVNSDVTEVPDFAFSNRSELRSIEFTTPNTLTKIGYYAFADCDKLSSITIPKNVTTIGDGAFSFSSGLRSIIVDSGNANYSSANSILYNKNKTQLIQYPIGAACYDEITNPNPTTSVTIINSVREICDHAFNDCTSLKSVSAGANLQIIGDYAFSGCSSLENVALGDGVQNIGTCAFYDCPELSSIVIPKSVVSIEPRALGYYNMGGKYSPFWIRGYVKTEAEKYAKRNDIKFIEIFEPIYPTGITWVTDRIVSNINPGDTYTLPSEGTCVADIVVNLGGQKVSLTYLEDYKVTESGGSIVVTFFNTETMRSRDSTSVTIKMGYERPQTTINVGRTYKCEAYVLPPNATYRDIIYSSSNTNYLTTGNGTVTAVNIGMSQGDYIPVYPVVTASTAYGDHHAVTCVWKVIKKAEEVQIGELPTVTAGKVQRISASLHPVDPAGNNITTTRKIQWSIEDSDIAEILDPDGSHISELTYHRSDASPLTATCQIIPKQPGSTKITARAVDFDGQINGVFAESTLTIEKPGKNDAQIVIRGNANGLTANSKYVVEIFLKNNPGIVGLNLKLKYDLNYLRLSQVKNTEQDGRTIFDKFYHCNVQLQNPYPLSWASNTAAENVDFSGKLATVEFSLYQTVDENKDLPVSVFYDEENLDIYNVDLAPVDFAVTNSTIRVTNIVYGDVNSDGNVNEADVLKISRYLAEWSGDANIIHTIPQHGKTYTEAEAAELTSDGMINHKDQVILARYVDSTQFYINTIKETVSPDSQVTLPDDAIDKDTSTSPVIVPLVRITKQLTVYNKLENKPSDWDTEYKAYYVKEDSEYVKNTSSTWESNKYYERKTQTVTLQEGKSKDYTVDDATKKIITFNESYNIKKDEDTEVTIIYKIYSHWKGTDYDVIPFDE